MPRRSTRTRGPVKVQVEAMQIDDDDDDHDEEEEEEQQREEEVVPIVSRRSGRANKFASSLKEPANSIKDLLGGLSEKVPANKKKKKTSQSQSRGRGRSKSKKNDSDSVDEQSDESEDEMEVDEDEASEDERPVRRSTRSKNATPPEPASPPPSRTVKKPMKSPAVRHSKARKKMKLEKRVETDTEEESDSEDDSSVENSSDEDQPEVKIQRIVAVRMESKKKWKEICEKINTSEIDDGSRWFQEDLNEDELNKFEELFLVKWADLSFLHCSWEKKEDLIDQVDGAKTYLGTFFRKNQHGFFYDADERMDGEYFDPNFVQIERILEVSPPDDWNGNKKNNDWGIIHDKDHPDYENGTGRSFLIKWGNTSYSDSTYEYERDLILMDIEYESHLNDFFDRSKKPSKSAVKKVFSSQEAEKRRLYKVFGDSIKDGATKEKLIENYKKGLEKYNFKNGGQLRDYQAEGVCWLLANHVNDRSAILADEMGLGKTIQTAAYVEMVANRLHATGPFLIVAPLSTIPHWQREFSGWTNLNTIVYHGSQKDREVIREFEFAYECDRPQGGVGINQRYLNKCHKRKYTKFERLWMTQVIITTPEMLVTDDFNELTAVEWELLVVDEAHRLKSHSSKLAVNLRNDRFVFKHTLLLTGTPIQNNMSELWALMNVVDPDEFDNCDDFMERYDNMQSKDRVDELHEVIRPYILRRLKEDVEKSVPPKEETLIEVELTVLQKQYYRALYEKNVHFLHRDVKKAVDGPSLNNLAMQLRKCCNHPFLLEGVEDKAKSGANLQTEKDEADFLAKASGKLILLDKLLPKLKDGGHKVLIFSQFKIMLDIIEDYLALRNFKHERIDGSITGKKRQMAIDRFQAKDSPVPSFIMLLSTRAGGVGINLTAADTCIIFDSDWNPQNDLQAQARCHRIGQTKSVQIYRLLTRKTYEMQMFHMSSLKMGLDQAVLQGIENGGTDDGANMTKEEVERLLRHGAYDMFQEEKDGNAEKASNEFEEQDINTILERRARTVVHENTGSNSNAAGGTFSKASFKAMTGSEMGGSEGAANKDVDIDDPDFWTKMVGESKVEENDILKSSKKRSRSDKVVYDERLFHQGLEESIAISDASSSASTDSSENSDDYFDLDNGVIEEFDFSIELKNLHLKQLTEARKEELKWKEKKYWGGKSDWHWSFADAEILLKLLRRYGYGNGDGKKSMEFIWNKFKSRASKAYDKKEVQRMSWSFCFFALLEAAEENVCDVARRVQRDAKKRESGSPGQIKQHPLDVKPSETNTEEWKKKQRILSFGRYLNSSLWINSVLQGACEFADKEKPRDPDAIYAAEELGNQERPLLEAFTESILPALVNRGWKEQITKAKKHVMVGPTGVSYNSIAEILDCLPFLYPELESTVMSIISGFVRNMKCKSEEKNRLDKAKPPRLKAETMTFDQLSLFLRSYAPLQLVFDRKHSRRITIVPQRLLTTLSYMHTAHGLVKLVSTENTNIGAREIRLKLSKLIDVSSKAALPHPQWASIHDAVLVSAIVKHGWIDRDSHCRAIIEDKDMKWGAPFEKCSSKEDESSLQKSEKNESHIESIRSVADRVAKFLNKEHEYIKDFKGFNLNLILKTYSIVSTKKDDGTNSSRIWKVDYDELINSLNVDEGAASDVDLDDVEFPSKKDLLRRARILLSRLPPSISTNSKPKSDSLSHNFSALDQSNPSNTFLSELIREAIKVGQKQQTWIDRLLSTAQAEAEARSLESSTIVEESAELKKISEHIVLVKRNSKPFVRGAKNVLRVILGLEAHQPNKAGDGVFVKERKPAPVIVKKKKEKVATPKTIKASARKRKKRTENSTAGDLAVNKALAIGRNAANGVQLPKEKFLKLTSMETLMLSVLCSQGIPFCGDDWPSTLKRDSSENVDDNDNEVDEDVFALTWHQTGRVLENAAETWYGMTASRIANKKKKGLEIPEALQVQLEERQFVYAEATNLLEDNPINIAKKAIMLLQAVRLNTGNRLKGTNKKDTGIGSRTLQWSSNHVLKWSQAIGVIVDGKILHKTVVFCKPDVTPAAYFDEKGCANIYSQIVQQTRLRALSLKYDETEFFTRMLPRALKYCDANEREWEDRPSWWGNGDVRSGDDQSLIWGTLEYGYGGFDEMIRQDERFAKFASKASKTEIFDRWAAQKRLDRLTRELSAIDDTTESMRLLNERKNGTSLNRKDNSDKSQPVSTVQVGIDAFFVPKTEHVKANGNIDDDSSSVEIVDNMLGKSDDDSSSVEIVDNMLGKRKSTPITNNVSPDKKPKC